MGVGLKLLLARIHLINFDLDKKMGVYVLFWLVMLKCFLEASQAP